MNSLLQMLQRDRENRSSFRVAWFKLECFSNIVLLQFGKFMGVRQRWRVGAGCNPVVNDLAGSNPAAPTIDPHYLNGAMGR